MWLPWSLILYAALESKARNILSMSTKHVLALGAICVVVYLLLIGSYIWLGKPHSELNFINNNFKDLEKKSCNNIVAKYPNIILMLKILHLFKKLHWYLFSYEMICKWKKSKCGNIPSNGELLRIPLYLPTLMNGIRIIF